MTSGAVMPGVTLSSPSLLEPRGGVTSLRVTTAGGRSHVVLRGRGSLLDAPYLPLRAPDGLVVQLQDAATGLKEASEPCEGESRVASSTGERPRSCAQITSGAR